MYNPMNDFLSQASASPAPLADAATASRVIGDTAPSIQGDRIVFDNERDFRDYVEARIVLGIRAWAASRNIDVDNAAGGAFGNMFSGMLQMSMAAQTEMMKFNMMMAQARMQQQMFQQMLGAFGGAMGGGQGSFGQAAGFLE